MISRDVPQSASGAPSCALCGDVIGVYEPAVCLVGDRVTTTSRAADQAMLWRADARYHAGCWFPSEGGSDGTSV